MPRFWNRSLRGTGSSDRLGVMHARLPDLQGEPEQRSALLCAAEGGGTGMAIAGRAGRCGARVAPVSTGAGGIGEGANAAQLGDETHGVEE